MKMEVHDYQQVAGRWQPNSPDTWDHLRGVARTSLRTIGQLRPRKRQLNAALHRLDMCSDMGVDLSQFNIGPTALRRIAEHKLKK